MAENSQNSQSSWIEDINNGHFLDACKHYISDLREDLDMILHLEPIHTTRLIDKFGISHQVSSSAWSEVHTSRGVYAISQDNEVLGRIHEEGFLYASNSGSLVSEGICLPSKDGWSDYHKFIDYNPDDRGKRDEILKDLR